MSQSVVTILIIVAVIAILAAGAVMTLAVARKRGKGRQFRFKIELSNESNVASRFELQADDPSGLLSFLFVRDGTPLGSRQGALLAGGVPQKGRATATPQPPVAASGESSGLKQKASSAMGASGAIADMLMTIGNILPSSLGMPLVNLGSQMRYGEYAADRVGQVPGQIQRMTQIGQSSGGTFVPGGNLPPSSSPQASQASGEPAQIEATSWAQTPMVAAGATLALDLSVEPANAALSQQCAFTVKSRAAEDPGGNTNIEHGDVRLEGISVLQRALPWAIYGALAIAVIFCGILLIANYRG